ncbi:MAG: cytochrome c, partial [Planctomycetota bacterium]
LGLWVFVGFLSSPPAMAIAQTRLAGVDRLLSHSDTDFGVAGAALYRGLNCARCHSGDADAEVVAPRLGAVGTRLRRRFVEAFLLEPHVVDPSTRMPSLLARFEPQKRQTVARELAAFLGSLRGEALNRGGKGDPKNGESLFHSIGCAACHGPLRGGGVAKNSFPDLDAKYRPGQLAAFLRNPLVVRPAGRMPHLRLREEEAANLAAYLRKATRRGEPPSENKPSTLDEGDVTRGKEHFRSLSCSACHVGVLEKEEPRNVDLRPGQSNSGCLSISRTPTVPNFSLSPRERELLVEHVARAKRTTSAAKSLDIELTARNCLACHARGSYGGPGDRNSLFVAAVEADLGDEGRFPPPLHDVGRKLKKVWLSQVVTGKKAVRPYLATRMPGFGETAGKTMAELFARVDARKDRYPGEVVGRNRYGRSLVGEKGLRCIICHELNGRRSLGIPALDLATIPGRLRPEWFREYMIDPAKFRPGTRMPSFWPEGKAVNRSVLGGNVGKQLDAIWVYLQEVDQTRLPDGLERKGSFELVPTGRPIVQRTFFQSAGTHAIVVGFPEKRHAVFDADACRWVFAWRGRFFDVEGTWDDRFAPFGDSLSKDRFSFPPGPSLARLAEASSVWPRVASSKPGFSGYRFSKKRVPTFLYRAEGVDVTDELRPQQDGTGVERELRFSGTVDSLWFRALVSKSSIERVSPLKFRSGSVRVEAKAAREASIRPSGDGFELLLRVSPSPDGDRLTLRWDW